MTYALSAGLQAAVFVALRRDPALAEHLGDAIYDSPPQGGTDPIFLQLGGETVQASGDKLASGAEHSLTLRLVSTRPGFFALKKAAGAVCDALCDKNLVLERGVMTAFRFHRASATLIRDGTARQVDLVFKARLEDSAALSEGE